MNTKTRGTNNLKGGLRCDICGKKAAMASPKYGRKCWDHLPKVGA